jgi:hypothetical protein
MAFGLPDTCLCVGALGSLVHPCNALAVGSLVYQYISAMEKWDMDARFVCSELVRVIPMGVLINPLGRSIGNALLLYRLCIHAKNDLFL